MPSPHNWIQIAGTSPRRWRLNDGTTAWEIIERPWNAQFFAGHFDIEWNGRHMNTIAMLFAARDYVARKIAEREAV
jgi:hypothetical protein